MPDQNSSSDTSKTAAFVRRLSRGAGEMRLYRLSVPLPSNRGVDADAPHAHYEHVVVSATVVPYSGPETYIFGADSAGKIIDWAELSGSYRGGLDHAEALRGAGYEVTA